MLKTMYAEESLVEYRSMEGGVYSIYEKDMWYSFFFFGFLRFIVLYVDEVFNLECVWNVICRKTRAWNEGQNCNY